jgi:UDP-glucose 4-epimerase
VKETKLSTGEARRAGEPRRALITGGAGFIGSHLGEALLANGCSVTVIDDLSTGRLANIEHLAPNPRFRSVVGSILDETILDGLVRECDVVYHLAAAVGVRLILEDPVHVIETNVLGTQAVLEVALRHRKKVILASTSEIYGKSRDVPSREESDRLLGPTNNPRWSYSTSKAVDEYLALAYCHQKGLPLVIARLFNTIGVRQTGQYGMVVPRFVSQACSGERLTVYGDGRQSRSFCDVRDTVGALIGLAEQEAAEGEIFNVGSSVETTILDLAQLVLSVVDPTRGSEDSAADRIVFVPYEEAYSRGFEDMRRRVPDTGKIHRCTGWSARIPLEKTIQDVVTAWRECG